jgi:lysophospholipase L1-like esterase
MGGIGDATVERENAETKQKEVVASFGAYLRRYIADIRAKGATPILCTLVPRNIWEGGTIARPASSHADWTRAVAAAEHVPLVDLNERIAQRYDALGATAVGQLFADGRVHTTAAGAEVSAGIVADALRALPGNPLNAYMER